MQNNYKNVSDEEKKKYAMRATKAVAATIDEGYKTVTSAMELAKVIKMDEEETKALYNHLINTIAIDAMLTLKDQVEDLREELKKAS